MEANQKKVQIDDYTTILGNLPKLIFDIFGLSGASQLLVLLVAIVLMYLMYLGYKEIKSWLGRSN